MNHYKGNVCYRSVSLGKAASGNTVVCSITPHILHVLSETCLCNTLQHCTQQQRYTHQQCIFREIKGSTYGNTCTFISQTQTMKREL